MAFLHVENVRLAGLAACVPALSVENTHLNFLSAEEALEIIASIGIERRRVAQGNICTSDLCYEAAEKLINELAWNKEEIDCLILVTQTPDYILPATSCILQERLGLNEECYTLDVQLGCSAWVYGLNIISSLLAKGQMKKGLLLVGDRLTGIRSDLDKDAFLYGDCGTAAAIEFQEGEDGFRFHLATDGSGAQAIIIPDGGYRNPFSLGSSEMTEVAPGRRKTRSHIQMDGMDVFSFAISKAPESVTKLINHFYLNKEQTDYFVFHQSNLLANEQIRNKLKLPENKVPYSLREFGNTGGASIPLTIVTALKNEIQSKPLKLICCGFGVGLSWGSVVLQTSHVKCCELIEL